MYRDPIGYRIKTLSNLMKRSMDKLLGQKPDHATLMQTWIIGFLQDRADEELETFQKDIEREFSINRSTTSEMLKLMCKKGMIERVTVSHDARLKKIVLTDQSLQFNKVIEDKMKEMYEVLTKDFTKEEIDTFIKLSDKMIKNIKDNL